MIDTGRLALYVRRPSGQLRRIAGDEELAENVLQSLQFGTAMPGGFSTMSCAVTGDLESLDLSLFDEVVLLGPGGEIAWEGYITALPGRQNTQAQIGITATGWSSALKDSSDFRMVYSNRDMSQFVGPSDARRAILIANNRQVHDHSLDDGGNSGTPGLSMSLTGPQVAPRTAICEAWVDAGPGNTIARVPYSYTCSTSGFLRLNVCDDDIGTNQTSGSNLATVSSGSGVFTPVTPRRWLLIEWIALGQIAGDGSTLLAVMRNLAVMCSHGLTVRGAAPAEGFYPSDVVADVVNRSATPLKATTGADGSVQPTSNYPVPHLEFRDGVSPDEAILRAAKTEVPDWGAYDNRTFFYRPAATGRTWIARTDDDGVTFDPAGPQAEDAYDGVFVTYTDPTGVQRSAGPPGSNAHVTDSRLADSSESDLNVHGRTRTGPLDLPVQATQADAIEAGEAWLKDKLAIIDRGDVVLTGEVVDEFGQCEPVNRMRAGDRLVLSDVSRRAIPIVETGHDYEQRRTACSLDSPPDKLEAQYERVQAELTARGA